MNRRHFLKLLSASAASVAAPRLIFDMGANLYKYDRERESHEAAQLIADKCVEYYFRLEADYHKDQNGKILMGVKRVPYAYRYLGSSSNGRTIFADEPVGSVGGIWRA